MEKIDEETAVKFLEKYRKANLRIPRSRWIYLVNKKNRWYIDDGRDYRVNLGGLMNK